MKKKLLLITLIGFYFYPVFSQVLYTNAAIAGFSFNPGNGISGTPRILFDDILIPSARVQGTDSIKITKVKFGILRDSAAPAVTVKFYYTVVEDTARMFGNLIKLPPVLLGSIDLPANGPADAGTIISLGDSIATLFKVKTDTGKIYTGYQLFFLGLSFSNNAGTNGWALTIPGAPDSENDDVVWMYDVDRLEPRFATFFGGPPNPSATFYLEVFGGASTLPVTLAQFTARRSGNTNLLSWNTKQELNSSKFVIERSGDGSSFVSIGQVAAAGNSNTVRNYNFTDIHPAKGYNYYRLRTVDKDNSSKLSDTRKIRNEGIADAGIFPNPVTDQLNVAINADKAVSGQLTITDAGGRAVYSGPVKLPQGNTIVPVSVNNIAAGSYILKIQLGDDVIIRKFNKQ